MDAKSENTRDISFWLREIILGGQDGVVNVLGIVLAVAAATDDTRIVLISGLAGGAAESLSMVAVAYTSNLAVSDYYHSRLQQEIRQVKEDPEGAERDVRKIYEQKGFKGEELDMIVRRITSDKQVWVDTMMSEELRLFPEEANRARTSAIVVGVAVVIGSLMPLVPFMFGSIKAGIIGSIVVCLIALFATGAIKARMTVGNWLKSGIQMASIGLGAAMAGYGIGMLLGQLPQ